MQCVKVCRGEYNIAHQSDFLIRRTENGSKLYLRHSFLNPVEVRRRDPAAGYEKPRADNHRQQHSDGDPDRSGLSETHKGDCTAQKKPLSASIPRHRDRDEQAGAEQERATFGKTHKVNSSVKTF